MSKSFSLLQRTGLIGDELNYCSRHISSLWQIMKYCTLTDHFRFIDSRFKFHSTFWFTCWFLILISSFLECHDKYKQACKEQVLAHRSVLVILQADSDVPWWLTRIQQSLESKDISMTYKVLITHSAYLMVTQKRQKVVTLSQIKPPPGLQNSIWVRLNLERFMQLLRSKKQNRNSPA